MESKITPYFNNKDFSDFTIKCNNRMIYVNKMILHRNCDFFKNLFDVHSDDSTLEINLFSYENLKNALLIIYTYELNISWELHINFNYEILLVLDFLMFNIEHIVNYIFKKRDDHYLEIMNNIDLLWNISCIKEGFIREIIFLDNNYKYLFKLSFDKIKFIVDKYFFCFYSNNSPIEFKNSIPKEMNEYFVNKIKMSYVSINNDFFTNHDKYPLRYFEIREIVCNKCKEVIKFCSFDDLSKSDGISIKYDNIICVGCMFAKMYGY